MAKKKLETGAIELADVPVDKRPRYRWGEWYLRPSVGELLCRPYGYGIPLGRCLSAAQVLDWIAQVAHKRWATDDILADLVRALDDIIDLQRNACGCGREPRDVESRIRRQFADKGIKLVVMGNAR
jgi:hypothetical protein